LRQNSLFGEKKFFVVKNPISNKEFKELVIEKIKEIAASEHNIVFCQEGKVLKADRLLKTLVKCGQAQEFAPLDGPQLNLWIAAEFKRLGSLICPQAVQLLAARAGNDLWVLENEIQKLAHFCAGREITARNIENGVAAVAESNIFQTVDAVAARDKKQALLLVKKHIGEGDHPLYLLTMMASQFRNLLLVKASGGAGSAGRLGIHPYVFGKTVAQARRFGLNELAGIYRKVCQADFDIKTGKLVPESGLDLLIANI
jgi:DNA polymerase-3 subunit delta